MNQRVIKGQRPGCALTCEFTFQGKETFASLYGHQQVNGPSGSSHWHVHICDPYKRERVGFSLLLEV